MKIEGETIVVHEDKMKIEDDRRRAVPTIIYDDPYHRYAPYVYYVWPSGEYILRILSYARTVWR